MIKDNIDNNIHGYLRGLVDKELHDQIYPYSNKLISTLNQISYRGINIGIELNIVDILKSQAVENINNEIH